MILQNLSMNSNVIIFYYFYLHYHNYTLLMMITSYHLTNPLQIYYNLLISNFIIYIIFIHQFKYQLRYLINFIILFKFFILFLHFIFLN